MSDVTNLNAKDVNNLWKAPFSNSAINALVSVPGSKSLSNRYLILAAIGKKPVVLKGLLRSRDTELMINALSVFGVKCNSLSEDAQQFALFRLKMAFLA